MKTVITATWGALVVFTSSYSWLRNGGNLGQDDCSCVVRGSLPTGF